MFRSIQRTPPVGIPGVADFLKKHRNCLEDIDHPAHKLRAIIYTVGLMCDRLEASSVDLVRRLKEWKQSGQNDSIAKQVYDETLRQCLYACNETLKSLVTPLRDKANAAGDEKTRHAGWLEQKMSGVARRKNKMPRSSMPSSRAGHLRSRLSSSNRNRCRKTHPMFKEHWGRVLLHPPEIGSHLLQGVALPVIHLCGTLCCLLRQGFYLLGLHRAVLRELVVLPRGFVLDLVDDLMTILPLWSRRFEKNKLRPHFPLDATLMLISVLGIGLLRLLPIPACAVSPVRAPPGDWVPGRARDPSEIRAAAAALPYADSRGMNRAAPVAPKARPVIYAAAPAVPKARPIIYAEQARGLAPRRGEVHRSPSRLVVHLENDQLVWSYLERRWVRHSQVASPPQGARSRFPPPGQFRGSRGDQYNR